MTETHSTRWRPSPDRARSSNMAAFIDQLARRGHSHADYESLWRWSVNDPESFWRALWSFTGVRAKSQGNIVLRPGGHMTESVFFPEAELNFADNMLRGRTDGPAIIFGNDQGQERSVSWAELTAEVAAIAVLLRDLGLRQQDRVAAILPNIPEAVSGFLATAAVGGIWAACSPDFGVEAILDRFTIIQPKILIATDGYVENGAICPTFDKIQQVAAGLPSVETVIWVRYTADQRDFDLQIQRVGKSLSWHAARAAIGAVPLQCDALPFNAPLCILFTSGTTGPPKCLIHRAGGVLLQHLKEHQLHCDIRPGDRIFYYTSCAWVMWHWMSSALASGATLLLYDGSPYFPSPSALFSFAERHQATLFGISPRFLTDCAQIKLSPKNQCDLRHLRTVISTGSPLSAAMFDYVYEEIGHDLHLISIYGGTDIASCFGQGNPMAPVRAGEIQVPALGMAVDIVDPQGNALPHGVGELVCRAPFPSLPLGLWNDESGARYRETYFAQFPSMWRHADWAEWTPSGGLIVHGRADTTINPGGVRIGTAELYRVLEGLDFLRDFVAVGELADEVERILLFVVPRQRPDTPLPDPLKREIRHQISTRLSRHHVPQKILSVGAIPMTRNGKVAEAAVRNIVRGQPVANATALRNPESLAAIKAAFEGAKPG